MTDQEARAVRERLEKAKGSGEGEGAIRSAAALANSLAGQGELEGAYALLDQAAETAQSIERADLQARLLEQKAMLLTQDERSDDALDAIEAAIKVARDVEAPGLAEELEIRRAIVLANLGRLPEAIAVVRDVLGRVEDQSAPAHARLLDLLGNLYLRSAQDAKAEQAFQQALESAADRSQPSEMRRLRIGLSRAFVGQEKYSDAQSLLLGELEESGDEAGTDEVWGLLNPAIEVSYKLEDWDTLIDLTKQAMIMAAKEGEPREANIHRENLISVLMRVERLEQAKSHLRDALDFARRQGPRERKLVHLTNLGRVCFDLDELEEAEEYYQEALSEAKSQDDQRSEVIILGRLGALKADQSDMKQAVELGQTSAEKAEQIGDPLILAEQLILLALTYRDLDRREEAIAASTRAADLYRQQGEEAFSQSAQSLAEQLRAKK